MGRTRTKRPMPHCRAGKIQPGLDGAGANLEKSLALAKAIGVGWDISSTDYVPVKSSTSQVLGV